jgi:hypothetical protein
LFFYSSPDPQQITENNNSGQNSGSQNASGSSGSVSLTYSFQEQFEDSSWPGSTRIDWTGVADPASEAANLDFSGLWSEYVIYTGIFSSSFDVGSESMQELYEYGLSGYVDPQFLLEPNIDEQFDDNSWDGLTKIDWTGVEDPASSAADLELYGSWSGTVLYSSIPQPDFSSGSSGIAEIYEDLSSYVEPQFLLEPQINEQFDDTLWGGLTKIDWTGIEDPYSSAGKLELYGLWSGTVLYSSVPQPDFSSGVSTFTETYE